LYSLRGTEGQRVVGDCLEENNKRFQSEEKKKKREGNLTNPSIREKVFGGEEHSESCKSEVTRGG